MTDKTKIIAVGGSTASGKSALALSLAEMLGGEIVSCDSMAVYRGMDIGTAKPTSAELARVPHHMINVCEPAVNFSAADWVEGAARAICDIASRGRLPIICGGTGMYLDALLRPCSFSSAEGGSDSSEKLREELRCFAKEHGNDALHARLREIDPEAAEATHPNNLKRVIRALEIYYTTGITKTESDRRTKDGEAPYDCRIVTLDYESRDVLYSRIDRRVDIMAEAGLADEVKKLYESALLPETSTAAQGIGYKEMLLYVKGALPVESAIDMIKKNTRNYAKRQITWFKRYRDISIVPDRDGMMRSADELACEVINRL